MTSVSNWIPVEYDPLTVARANAASAILSLAEGVPMGSSSVYVRRDGGNSVSIGKTYADDDSDHDKIQLLAKNFQGQNLFDEDDLADGESWAPIAKSRANQWLISFASKFDNACIGVTGAYSATDNLGRPYTSVYKKVKTNGDADSSEADYVASANYVDGGSLATSAAYNSLSSALGVVEGGEFWDESQALIIASPKFRQVLRNVKDANGTPVFVAGQGQDSGQPDRLFGVEIHWSRGACTSAAASNSPEGNPLMVFVGKRDLLIRGDRLGVVSRVGAPDSHASTDQVALKFKTRRGFAVGNIKGISVLEKTA